MALPQDGQDANGLTKVTQIPAGKELMFIDPTTNEGGIITLEDLTKQILNGLTSQTFGLDSGTQTLPAAINYLYGKISSDVVTVSNLEEAYTQYKTCIMPIYIRDAAKDYGDFYLIQIYRSTEYGVQILISLGENIIRYRRLVKTWNAFVKIN